MRTFTHAYLDDPDTEDDGPWFYLEFQEPRLCNVCKQYKPYMHVTIDGGVCAIIIFDTHDDPVLLHSAAIWQKEGMDPRISEYEPDLGLSIPIQDLCKILNYNYESLYEAMTDE